jgi:DNA helicase-2/ATP-dependent DNA helicase PcrA
MSVWTQGLNPEQVSAVQHNNGPMLILAGAGSGKTTVLVSRTGRLITENVVRAENTLVLTFTNKAARELKHRVASKVGDIAKGLWAGTFHSFGLRILREFHREANLPAYFGVLDQNDSQGILREIIRDIKIAGKDKFDLGQVLELINKRRVAGREKIEGFDEYHEMAEIMLPKYLKKLELLGAMDFEGLLLKPVELLKTHPEILQKIQARHQQVMVDEFQDTNVTQMKLIDAIVRDHRNITVVGDDDQSIYGWRGAEVRNILDFPKLYPPCEVIRLERNYRSTPEILKIANDVIQKNKQRHGKILRSEGHSEQGEIPELFVIENDDEEAEFAQREIREFLAKGFAAKDIALLYRSNAQGGMLESVLRQHQIPYRVSGGTAFFDRKEIKDILAYLRFSLQPNDVSLRRIINTPSRGIGDTSIEKISIHARDRQISFVQACSVWRLLEVPERAGVAIDEFLQQLQGLAKRIMTGPQPGPNLIEYLRSIGYRDYLYHTSANSEAGEKKWNLVEIFARVLDSFAAKGGVSETTLREFVDAMELRDEQDDDSEKERNKVSLMTLHASKGLEFPVVMLLGVEEDLLPHKTLGANVDEERRLFYVGLTRAKKHLLLTRCKQRKKHGRSVPVTISRFLLEIPQGSLRVYEHGMRPVSGDQRQQLVADFMNRLANKQNSK